MRPPSFKMELPPDHHHRDIKPLLPPPTMPHHHNDPPIEVNELPPAKFKPSVKAAADSDETEYSTSFADTAATNDNNSSALSDTEVESKLHSDTNGFSSSFDEFGGAFRVRKKKLTNHWRNFIRPVMWRCKWAELKIKQFESQALKYAKTIAAYDQTKHLANQSIPEGFTSRSMPFTCQGRQSKLIKRRKRVRVEDTTDAKLYMSKHILFSHESRKSDPDGASMTEEFDDPVLTGQITTSQEELGFEQQHKKWSFLEDKDDEMEQMLEKIDVAQTRVHKLKSQLDLVMSENVVNHLANTVRSPTFSTCNNNGGGGGSCENGVSSYGEGFHIPDIIESTVGLPSSLDVTHHQSQVADSSENIVDNMVGHNNNQGGEAEKPSLRNCQQQQQVVVVVKQEGDKSEEDEEEGEDEEEEEESTHPGIAIGQEQSSMISSLASGFQIPKNKRKRGERKAGTANWSRQRPGEPDTS